MALYNNMYLYVVQVECMSIFDLCNAGYCAHKDEQLKYNMVTHKWIKENVLVSDPNYFYSHLKSS